MTYDLSLLIRTLFGFGTPKQWVAKARLFVWWLMKRVQMAFEIIVTAKGTVLTAAQRKLHYLHKILQKPIAITSRSRFSTGC